jgi:2-methylisocitrate lyase-like PEP mutase family enzyme
VDWSNDKPSQVAENVKMLLDAGVVGINIEDELPESRLPKDELFTFL